jgi:hypothetical protein
MTFTPGSFANFIAGRDPVYQRVSPSYTGSGTEFDIIIVGSGMGGGVLADALADRFGTAKRILVLEAGTYLYPTHVYNCSRLPNADVAQRFACSTFWQAGDEDAQNYIHERPQLNFGGRSIFWSGLIPTIQGWELDFFPQAVRQDLASGLLVEAGQVMNESINMGDTAVKIVERLTATPLDADFDIRQTPRALHQPYLRPDGVPASEFFVEPTGVFNTAELLVNQLGLSSDGNSGGDGQGLRLLLNHFVEDIQRLGDGRQQVVVRDTLSGQARLFQAGTVVLAAGSIESPKLLGRSTLGRELPEDVRGLVGRGLTDHPTTSEVFTTATHIAGLPIPRQSTAKIIFYSRGRRDNDGRIVYPFNVEMNVNHEYWHLRDDDPSAEAPPAGAESRVDIKFSFGNCLDPANEIRPAPPFGYVPEIVFRNQSWTSHLCGSRFPALAKWQFDDRQVFAVLNDVAGRILSAFSNAGQACAPSGRYGEDGAGFGYGTVHHAAGSLRMPYRAAIDAAQQNGVVDEDLRVRGTRNLYVCDMSVMPMATAANPVRTLTALALRLSRHLA